ncbi:MAG: glycosyltransferase, partial [Cyanobacteria bacterium J06576_12]
MKKLQRYVPFNPINAVDPESPFQIFFDQVIPVGCDGIFVAGWLHDPYESLDEIEAITALGFRFSVSVEHIYRTERQDVREHLSQTRYGRFDAKPGFFAYIQADQETRDLLEGFDQFHNVRFCIRLKDKISVDVTPDIKFCDVFTARSIVSQIISPDQVNDDMIEHCIAPAAAKLQGLCMEKIKIQKVIDIGTPWESPVASIVIPLYKRIDFIKVQIPLFANDPTLRNSEIIYVLDSPWQAKELTAFLREHCQLYQLPIKLVIMQRNSGYSSANNAGASQARGKYILLMNSDVFPRASGWIDKMIEFYQSSPEIGTVGAKLVYEDGSIQHAGMFFEKTTFPFWLTLHYYKGFPNKYGPANTARAVPSVTGACLLIAKELYDQVGGMSTEYVIGDFEDSDLCFKCVSQG